MPKAIPLESAIHIALNIAWLVGALVIAYALGVALSWLLRRVNGRSAVISDIEVLTRGPVRATLMVIAATSAVHHLSNSTVTTRGWLEPRPGHRAPGRHNMVGRQPGTGRRTARGRALRRR